MHDNHKVKGDCLNPDLLHEMQNLHRLLQSIGFQITVFSVFISFALNAVVPLNHLSDMAMSV